MISRLRDRLAFLISFFSALFTFTSTFTNSAHAFPEMIRHGYVNCTTCHVSPSGGGLMTQYGRSLSRELLSWKGYEGEEDLLQGLIKAEQLPQWLNVGGDIRAVQTQRENKAIRDLRFIWMQADLEAAVTHGRWTALGTIGRIERRTGPSAESRRYFAMYQATDELAVRAGKFTPAYGLNIPDHFINVRRELGFDNDRETNNLEVSWIGEAWNAFATFVTSPGEITPTQRENAVSLKVERAVLDRFKIGMSAWSGKSDVTDRKMLGVQGALGITPRLYLLTESDLQWKETLATSRTSRGFFNHQRLGYEVVQGVHLIALNEYTHTDLDDAMSVRDSYGAGATFYPRPHLEFQGVWQKARARSSGEQYDDFAWLLAHYYF